jgi:hypothetical protein
VKGEAWFDPSLLVESSSKRSVAAQIHREIENMKLAFVIRLGSDSRPSQGLFEGWVEEVDSCTERRFHSTGELLAFLGQCFDAVTSLPSENGIRDGEPAPCRKKIPRQKKESS